MQVQSSGVNHATLIIRCMWNFTEMNGILAQLFLACLSLSIFGNVPSIMFENARGINTSRKTWNVRQIASLAPNLYSHSKSCESYIRIKEEKNNYAMIFRGILLVSHKYTWAHSSVVVQSPMYRTREKGELGDWTRLLLNSMRKVREEDFCCNYCN